MPTSSFSATMAVQQYLTYHQGHFDTRTRHMTLKDFLSAGPMGVAAMDTQERRRLTNALLADLKGLGSVVDDDREGEEYRLDVLKSLKELSRLPGGSVVQSEPTSLSILLEQVSIPPPASRPLRRYSSSSSSSSAASTTSGAASNQTTLGGAIQRAWTKQTSKYRSNSRNRLAPTGSTSQPTPTQWEITDVALRCINNALYLHETSRGTFAEERIGGGTKAIDLLRNPWQTPAEIIFLACRLLFFSTLFEASFNSRAVEEQGLIECLRDSLDALSVAYAQLDKSSSTSTRTVPSGNDDQIKAAMAEVLKVIFNLGIYYPRVAAGANNGNERLGVLLEPVLRLTVLLPVKSLASPASNAIGVLLNFPVKSNRARWLSTTDNISLSSCSSSPNSTSNSKRKGTAKRVAKAIFSKHGNRDTRSQSLLLPDGSTSSSSSLPSRSTSPTPSFTSTASPAPQQQPTMTPSSSNASTIRRDWETLSLADAQPDDIAPSTLVIEHVVSFLVHFLDRYFPPNATTSSLDPDDSSVRTQAKADNLDIEGAAQPLCLLLRNLSAEDEDLRLQIKKTLLPTDLDRTIAPDRRTDATGKLIRLMSSVTYPRLAQVTSELLFALCSSDAKSMVNEIGYGPCAGFLVSKGLVGAFPDAEPSSSSEARTINPISGQYDPTDSELAQDPINQMTQEEKEEEAERLFGLFDRLNRTGVVKVQHPVRDADEKTNARFEELQQEDEDKEEQQALREFAAYKARGARG